MKKNSRQLIESGIVLTALVATTIGAIFVRHSKNIPRTITSPSQVPVTNAVIGDNEHGETVSQTPKSKTLTPATDNYGSPEEWLVFNPDYQSSDDKRFRFKYPPDLELVDIDSGRVWLKKNNESYLTIEEAFPLTEFPKGDTPDEKFKAYYFYRKNIYKDYPELVFSRIDFSENTFLYKVALTHGSHYLGEINGHGIDLVDYERLPEVVVYKIIQTIEFR